jgi:preprotein translocase subunit SecE
MAKTPSANLPAQRRKGQTPKTVAPGKASLAAVPSAPPEPPKKRTTPTQFYNEVRTEARKITWTSWKETWITSVMVGIMVVITAIFFSAVDGMLSFLIQQLLKLASG